MSIIIIILVNALTVAAMYYLRGHGHPMHWLWVWGQAVACLVALVGAIVMTIGVTGQSDILFRSGLVLMLVPLLTLVIVWVKLVRILI